MTTAQQMITIGVAVGATILTRFLPYLLFPEGKKIPDFIYYLGKVLAPAVFGLLVLYCLKNVNFAGGSHGLPELLSILAVILLYKWKGGNGHSHDRWNRLLYDPDPADVIKISWQQDWKMVSPAGRRDQLSSAGRAERDKESER